MTKQRRAIAQTAEQMARTYRATPTLKAFHASTADVRGIKGPLGSGKSVGCAMEAYIRMLRQTPYKGVRRSRWAFVRNTYPELISTTMNTWKDWVPEEICPISLAPPICGLLELNLPDGTRVEAEIYFLAVESDEDVKKLKSFEFTGIWINEASEIRPKAILDMAVGRIDRYPPKFLGGRSWTGVIMDTNAPPDSHWWYKMAEISKPLGYEWFNQPPAIVKMPNKDPDAPPEYRVNDGTYGVPAAENLSSYSSENDPLGLSYYNRQIPGKDEDWLKVYLMGEYGSLFTGKPVFPEYSDKLHYCEDSGDEAADGHLMPNRGMPLILGWDFGLTPACVICQSTQRGQLRILDELYEEDMGIERFCRDVVKPHLENKYHGMQLHNIGDPAGNQRSQTNEMTMFQVMHQQGFKVESAGSNNLQMRREAVAWYLNRYVDGTGGMLLSKNIEIIRKGFRGGYFYRKKQVQHSDIYTEEPEKNEFSHLHDALQYVCLYLRKSSVENTVEQQFAGGGTRRRVTHKKNKAFG